MSNNIKAVPTHDYHAVAASAGNYVEGLRTGSANTLAEAFHPDAVMYGYLNGLLLGGPIENLYTFVETNGDAPDSVARVDILAITPTTAVVRVDMEKDAIGSDYNDYLLMIKIEREWKVIAKVFHQFSG